MYQFYANLTNLFKFFSKIALKLTGWKVDENFDLTITHGVAVFAPHTSNWDFFYAVASLSVMGINLKMLMKDSYFIFPLSIILNSCDINSRIVDSRPGPGP